MTSHKILIVEDESIVALDIQVTLQALGYDVVGIASAGSQAINEVTSTRPNLILMDIGLKGEMDGVEAAIFIDEHYHIPIIFLTAYGDKQTLERASKINPAKYLMKPIEKSELKSAIETALNMS